MKNHSFYLLNIGSIKNLWEYSVFVCEPCMVRVMKVPPYTLPPYRNKRNPKYPFDASKSCHTKFEIVALAKDGNLKSKLKKLQIYFMFNNLCKRKSIDFEQHLIKILTIKTQNTSLIIIERSFVSVVKSIKLIVGWKVQVSVELNGTSAVILA